MKHVLIFFLLMVAVWCQPNTPQKFQNIGIVVGILRGAYSTGDLGKIENCLARVPNFDSFTKNIQQAIKYIEEDTIPSKVSATRTLGAVLDDIIIMLRGCSEFNQDISKLEYAASELGSPITLYTKAYFNSGLKGIEAISYMKTAIASYRNNMPIEFGTMMGYTIYALLGGESKIKPANETLVEYCFNEQRLFYQQLQQKPLEKEALLNKSVRSLSGACTGRIHNTLCRPNVNFSNLKPGQQHAILLQLQQTHEFLFDSINDGDLFSKEQQLLFKSQFQCWKNLKVTDLTEDMVKMLDLLQQNCLNQQLGEIGNQLGNYARELCKDVEKNTKSDL